MNVLYCRISTAEQKTDRQRVNEKNYSLIIEDKCSGTIPFFEREGGKKIAFVQLGRISLMSMFSWNRV
jgi:DNA invertase Pin-like site-specific DNA recombinase